MSERIKGACVMRYTNRRILYFTLLTARTRVKFVVNILARRRRIRTTTMKVTERATIARTLQDIKKTETEERFELNRNKLQSETAYFAPVPPPCELDESYAYSL